MYINTTYLNFKKGLNKKAPEKSEASSIEKISNYFLMILVVPVPLSEAILRK